MCSSRNCLIPASLFLLPEFTQRQRVVARVHLFRLELCFPSLKGKFEIIKLMTRQSHWRFGYFVIRNSDLEVCDVLLEDAPLLLDALLLIRHADLHVVELGVELEFEIDKMLSYDL